VRARQLKRREEDLKKIRLYLQRVRELNKEYFDENYKLRAENFSISDLILLYNTKLDKNLFSKLAFK
jgi:hypothetical protein